MLAESIASRDYVSGSKFTYAYIFVTAELKLRMVSEQRSIISIVNTCDV